MNSQIIRILGEGEHFGDVALISNSYRTLSVVVTSETAKILSIDRETFLTLYDNIEHHLKKDYRQSRKVLPPPPKLSSFKKVSEENHGEFDDVEDAHKIGMSILSTMKKANTLREFEIKQNKVK